MRIITQLLLPVFLLFFSQLSAQNGQTPKRTCSTPVPSAEWGQWFNTRVLEREIVNATYKGQLSTYTIPVVVHVIHGGHSVGQYPNLSAQQINSQIAVLNADFSGNGANVQNVPPVYVPDVANCNINFSMAMLDPQGKALVEPGIHRVNWKDIAEDANPLLPASSSSFQTFFDKVIKPATIWDPTRYFNIWISDVKGTLYLLGYATFPAGSSLNGIAFGTGTAQDDGVWIWANAFGSTGSVHPLYNMGRTATHEIGHWLGLRHIWGDANCGNDYCADTPTQQSSNMGCPVFPKVSCSNGPDGDMFMNFMDYCDDACLSMFTWNQRSRMQTALENGFYRKQLSASASTLCNLPYQAPVAYFVTPPEACANEFVEIDDQSNGMPAPSRTWNILPAAGVQLHQPSNGESPKLVFPAPGDYTISVEASNNSGLSSISRQITVIDCGLVAGIQQQKAAPGLTLMPNPSKGEITVKGNFVQGTEVQLIIYNALGAKVYNRSFAADQPVSADLGSLPDGIYFADISNAGSRELKKIVLRR